MSGLATATLGDRSAVDGMGSPPITAGSAIAIARVIPGSSASTNELRTMSLPCLTTRATTGNLTRIVGKAKFNRPPDPTQWLERALHHDDYPVALPIHTTSTAWMIVSRHLKRAARDLHEGEDMKAAGLQQGERVDLTSHFEGEKRSARHFSWPYLPRGCTATMFPKQTRSSRSTAWPNGPGSRQASL